MASAAVVAFALVAGCGDSGPSITMADCTWPSCVTGLLATCVPSGQCTARFDRVTGASTWCFANGVKVQRTVTGTSSVDTCKNGNEVSYSIEEHTEFVGGVPAGVAFVIKDGSGRTAATGAAGSAGITVRCSSGPTFVLPATCSLPSPYRVDTPDGSTVNFTCDESSACVP
jgi:hypothetical protein